MMISTVRMLARAGFLLAVSTASPVVLAQHAGHDHGSKGSSTAPAAAARATGVVKKLDATKMSVTIAHEPVPSLNWPAMTMLFKVRDKTLLARLSAGAKIDFEFVQQGDDYIVTALK